MTVTFDGDTRPVWLLDFDGVVNVSRPGWSAPPRTSRAHVAGGTFRVRWAPSLVDRLARVHRSGLVDIRWASTWVGFEDVITAVTGLPLFAAAFPPAGPGAPSGMVDELKRDAAARVAAAGRPLVWTDDESIPAGSPLHGRDDCLLLVPDSRRGLQRGDVDTITAWLEQFRPAT